MCAERRPFWRLRCGDVSGFLVERLCRLRRRYLPSALGCVYNSLCNMIRNRAMSAVNSPSALSNIVLSDMRKPGCTLFFRARERFVSATTDVCSTVRLQQCSLQKRIFKPNPKSTPWYADFDYCYRRSHLTPQVHPSVYGFRPCDSRSWLTAS
ncbi:hypothetical protein CPB85DRAFT_570112 [Mucidula mucida]|nr:hypothetical protein CPB85DRAFT_570112 [Mucidula mucida]